MGKTMTRSRPAPVSNCDDGSTRDDRGSGKGYYGNLFAKPGVDLQKLAYNEEAGKLVVNTFRVLGYPDVEKKGVFHPARVPNADDPGAMPDATPFIERFMAFKGGDPGCTFLLYNPDDYPGQNWQELKWKFPSFILAQAVTKAGKQNEGAVWWQALLKGGKGKPAILKYPNWIYLAYALIYERGSEDAPTEPHGLDAKKPPVLLDMGKDVGEKVLKLCKMLKPEYADLGINGGLPEDVPVNKLFEIVAPVSLKNGVYFRAYGNKGKDPRKVERKDGGGGKYWDVPAGEEEQAFGYEVYATKQFNGKPATDLSEHSMQIWKRLGPIKQQLTFPTIEEQVAILAGQVKDPNGKPAIELLEYAFADRAEGDAWLAAIPDELRAQAKGKVAIGAGGKAGKGNAGDGLALARGKVKPDSTVPSADIDEDEDDEDDDKPAKKKSKKVAPAAKGKVKPADDEEDEDDDADVDADEDDDDEDAKPAKKGKPAAKAKKEPIEEEEDEDAEDADEDADEAEEDDDSDDEDDEDSDEDSDDEDVDDDADEDDDEPPVKKGKATAKPAAAKARKEPVEADEDEDGDDDDSDDEEEARPARKDKSAPAVAKKGGKKDLPFEEPPAPKAAAAKPGASNLAALKAAKAKKLAAARK